MIIYTLKEWLDKGLTEKTEPEELAGYTVIPTNELKRVNAELETYIDKYESILAANNKAITAISHLKSQKKSVMGVI